MEEQNKDIRDYLVAIQKRKTGVLIISVIVLFISILVAFMLPAQYKSSATILIEQQEIPQELVMSTVTSYAAERIQIIQARVMSRSNLMKIVDEFKLYEDERKYQTTEEILLEVTDDISLDIISAEVVDPRTGRPSSATIAFSVAFEGNSPEKVQRVANELTSLYLSENLKNRTQKAEDTSVFFQQESNRLSRLINDQESKLAEFKEKNSRMLPEMREVNLRQLQRKENELTSLETRMNTLEEKRFYINGQLLLIDPGDPTVPGVDMRLKILEAEYSSVRSKYSQDHPDVLRLKSEVEALRTSASGSDRASDIAKQLKEARSEQATLKDKYTEDHPDVSKLNEHIEKLEMELQHENKNAEDNYYRNEPDNPAYITLKAQLAGIESEIKSNHELKEKLIKKRDALENDLLMAPQVEREYRIVIRDYENAVREYNEAKIKLARADAAKTLESENKGERFTLIDPPALPEEPFSPNRPAILLLGVVFSIFSGVGFAFVADAISGSVRGVKGIRRQLGVAPLAVIPYQLTMQDIQKRKVLKKRTIIVALMAIVAGVLLVHFFISPLDVLWYRILRKIEVFTS